jgi:hypothetical protein
LTHDRVIASVLRNARVPQNAKQSIFSLPKKKDGLLRFARNDGPEEMAKLVNQNQ